MTLNDEFSWISNFAPRHKQMNVSPVLAGKGHFESIGLHRARSLPKYTISCIMAQVEQKKLKDRAPSWKLEIPGNAQHKDRCLEGKVAVSQGKTIFKIKHKGQNQ